MITQKELKEIVNYDPKQTSNRVKIGDKLQRTNNGYITVGILTEQYRVHRLAWLYVYGEWPVKYIDHINQIRDDNRICNLRCVDDLENSRNKKQYKRNKSGIVGVNWSNKRNKWEAYISISSKTISLGRFTDKEDAIKARKAAEIEYGFHKNHGK